MKILKKAQVLDRCGIGHTTLYAMIGKGIFPKPISLSPRRVGWSEAEVDAWIEAKIAERDARSSS